MMKRLRQWILLCAFLGIVNCSTDKETKHPTGNKDSAGSQPKSPTAPNPDLRVKTTLQPLPTANRYQILIEWENVREEPEAWVLHREDLSQGLRHLATIDKSKRSYLDGSVISGDTYHYYFSSIETADPSLKSKTTVVVPKDLEIEGTRELREVIGYNRLFLQPGTRIATKGEYLEIDVGEIVSREGVIESFTDKDGAPLGMAARHGGMISVRAQKGSGILYIHGRGEMGGRGSRGAQGLAGAKGASGRNAEIELYPLEGASEANRRAWAQLISDTERRGLIPFNHEEWKRWFRCSIPAGNGAAGAQGSPGGMGGEGGRGGNGAKIYVDIRDPSAIQIRAQSIPGLGGIGGDGGPGGAGGEGGDPGLLDRHHVCPVPQSGPTGPAGPVGPMGIAGINGIAQAVCLRLGPATLGDCHLFTIRGGRVW